MANQYIKPYLESSCFIAWIKGEVDNGVDKRKIVQSILKNAQQGHYRIVTSAWTLAEVYKRKKGPILELKACTKILEFFEHSFIEMVDLDRERGEQAHILARKYGLKPTDSVHLACAIRAKCDVLLSFDPDLTNLKEAVEEDHRIRVEVPDIIGQISFLGDIH